jgi:hypothetical protein
LACGQTLLPVSCAGPFRPEQGQCRHPGWPSGPPHLLRLNERITSSTVAVLPVPGMPLTYRHLPASAGSADTKQGRPGGRQVGRWPGGKSSSSRSRPARVPQRAVSQAACVAGDSSNLLDSPPRQEGSQESRQESRQTGRQASVQAGGTHHQTAPPPQSLPPGSAPSRGRAACVAPPPASARCAPAGK